MIDPNKAFIQMDTEAEIEKVKLRCGKCYRVIKIPKSAWKLVCSISNLCVRCKRCDNTDLWSDITGK